MNTTVTPLNAADLAALERDSWIDPATADAFGLYRVSSAEGAALVGRNDREEYAGIVFPIFGPGETLPREYFLRRDHPPLELHNGQLKPKRKYLAPPGRGNRLLFGPGESVDALTDTTLPILLVEGLKKTVAAWRLARHGGGAPKFLVCGISGAWNWKGTTGKAPDATGARVDVKGPIADLDRVTWPGRTVLLTYDSDASTNSSVAGARRGLVTELRQRGALVSAPDLPTLDGLDITGFDDFLARWGPDRVTDWLDAAQMTAELADDPEPIALDALAVPSFPTDVIPAAWLRDMIEATSTATETPAELALLLGLAVVATVAQKKYLIEPEPGYSEPLNIWTCPALDSGNRKTAVLMKMTDPLIAFERQHAAGISGDIVQAEAARRLAEDRVKYLRQKAAKAGGEELDSLRREVLDEEAALPEVPKALRLWCQDITPEKLGALMAEHSERMSILSDEGGLFDIMAGRYSAGVPNLDLFLQSHSGAPYRVDRGSRPSVFMENPALTIGLSPQPSVLRGLAKAPGFRGRGLLARFLYALPHSTLGRRTLEPRSVAFGIQSGYAEAMSSLLKSSPREDGHPHRLRFSAEAYVEWKQFQRHVEDELRDGGMFEHIRDWASKLPGAVARLAGILHCADHAGSQPESASVDLGTMEAALALGAVLERHALAVFGLMATDPNLDAAHKVWAWIERQRQPTFSRRDCFRSLQGTFPDVGSLDPAIEALIERAYLFSLPLTKGVGRPSVSFRVNRLIAAGWN